MAIWTMIMLFNGVALLHLCDLLSRPDEEKFYE
jgi:hypothetical protein